MTRDHQSSSTRTVVSNTPKKTQHFQEINMSRAIVFVLLVVAVVAYAFPQDPAVTYKCKENQIFNHCGMDCIPTCKNPHPTVCTLNCVIGCECKPGYVQNDDGDCVLTQDC